MRKRTYDFVDACVACQTSKPTTTKKAGLLNPIETKPLLFHTITIDFVVGLPKSKDGYNAMLSFTDKFTKCVKFLPCNDTITAKEMAELFIKHAYSTFGLPEKIISDRDPKFTSSFWRTLCEMLNIGLNMTTAYHLEADGQSERSNQTIETALRCMIGGNIEKYSKWTDYLPILEHEINSSKNASTDYSPNELRFTVVPRSIPDVLLSTKPNTPTNATAESLANDLQLCRNAAIAAIAKAQRIQKKYFDKRRTDKEFKEGELVILKFSKKSAAGYKPGERIHNSKMGPLGTPVRILKRISPVTYKIALPLGSKIHDTVSIAHLKKFSKDTGDIRPLPVISESDLGEEWEVESIDAHRIKKGHREFLVKWKGYSSDERTWEPVEHLDNSEELLLDYIAKNPDLQPLDHGTNQSK